MKVKRQQKTCDSYNGET